MIPFFVIFTCQYYVWDCLLQNSLNRVLTVYLTVRARLSGADVACSFPKKDPYLLFNYASIPGLLKSALPGFFFKRKTKNHAPSAVPGFELAMEGSQRTVADSFVHFVFFLYLFLFLFFFCVSLLPFLRWVFFGPYAVCVSYIEKVTHIVYIMYVLDEHIYSIEKGHHIFKCSSYISIRSLYIKI